MSDRPVVNPDARSPYQKYGKTPYKFPAWVTEGREPPLAIRDELRAARYLSVAAAEERRVKKKSKRNGHGYVRPRIAEGAALALACDPSAMELQRAGGRRILDTLVRISRPHGSAGEGAS